MLCSELLDGALRLLGEKGGAEENEDYAERAPYIIASFVCEAAEVDRRYRVANGMPTAKTVSAVYVPLEDEFPLNERLFPSAEFYLASILVADEAPELSERLYEKYCDSITSIYDSLPCITESIANCYG